MKEKSKILKLINKQNRLKFCHKWGGWILLVNVIISIGLLMPCVMSNITSTLKVLEYLYLGASVIAIGCHDIFGEEKIKQKMQDVDQEVLHLAKSDASEMQILREYDKVETIKKEINAKEREIKEQRQLVKELIKKKNLESVAQKNYIKFLTKTKKQNAKSETMKEVEEIHTLLEISNENII